jgi:enoyl-CoA hydratase
MTSNDATGAAGGRVHEDVRVARPAEGVLLLTIDRPAVRNALRTRTLAEIAAELAAAEDDPGTRVVVITGGSEHFAAGADVREMSALGAIDVLTHERARHWRTIGAFPKPLIAAVCGVALGGGCELALACDLVVAGTNAQFGQPEVNLGMIPGAGGASRLVRTCGKALAMQMVLTGRPIDARTALAAGIAVEVDEPESALARAIELAAVIASKPPVAVRLAKEAVRRALEVPLTDAVEADRQAFALLAASDDRREGIAAFLEKRPPAFTGR